MVRRLLVPAFVLLVGCKEDDAPPPRDPGVPTEEACDRTPADVYTAGIDHASTDGRLHVKILDATPAPPIVGDNTWTLQLVDGSGAPLVGKPPSLSVTNPARGLAAPRSPAVTLVDEPKAIYRVEKLFLGVVGVWRIEIGTSADAGASEVVHFDFCVTS